MPTKASAEAAVFYKLSVGEFEANCRPGDVKLIKPFIRNGEDYYCAYLPANSVTYEPASPTLDGVGYCPGGHAMRTMLDGSSSCIVGFPGGQPIVTEDFEGPSNVGYNIEADCKEGLNPGNCGIVSYLLIFINVLSGLVGITIVLMLIVGGIQYASSADDPNRVGAAKKRIFNALFALAAFIFMYSFLQWIVPGGIF